MNRTIQLFVAITTLTFSSLHGQVLKTIHVETPGSLSTLLTDDDRATVTDLTLTGSINSADYTTMKSTMTVLTAIDLSMVQTEGDSIPRYAFNSTITSLILPSSLTLIMNYGLAGCSGLTSLTIPSSVTSLGSYAFAGCSGLTHISIPDAVTSIGSWAFVSCSGLATVSLSNSITAIGEYTFAGCGSITGMIIPDAVTSIGKFAFVSCSGLTTISLSSSLDSIAMYTFAGCNNLTSVTIPSSVTSIGLYAFVSCQGLTSVNILPSSATTIKKYAFAGCTGLKTLTIQPSSGGTLIEDYSFVGCMALDSLTIYPSSGTTIGSYAFISSQDISTINFHSPSVTAIGEYSFANLRKLTTLNFPSSLTSIGNNSFRGSTTLTSVNFLPTSGTSIGDEAFHYCPVLTSLSMSSPSITSIGKNSFRNCSKLTTLELPLSLTSLGDHAFEDCSRLTSIVIPSSVDTFGFATFAGCMNIQSIRVNRIIPATIAVNSGVFANTNIYTCTLYVPTGTKEAYAAAYRWKDFTNIVEFDLLLSVSDDALDIADTVGSTATFTITSNSEWKISSDQNWLSISDTMDMNDGTIILTAEANPNAVERTAIVTIAGLGVAPKTVVVTQAPKPSLILSSNVLNIEAPAGSTVLLNITSNTSWAVNPDQSWLTASPDTGNGDAVVTLTAEANTAASIREAAVTVSGERVSSQVISVTQEAGSSAGINAISGESIRAYPNPVKDVLHITGAAGKSFEICNSNGQFILSQNLETDHELIDLSGLPPGLYVLKVGDSTLKISK